MPQNPSLKAVSTALEVSPAKAHRAVFFLAMNEIYSGLPAWRQNHGTNAALFGVDPNYVGLLRAYLDYRHNRRRLSAERLVRLHNEGIQIITAATMQPADLIGILNIHDMPMEVRRTHLLTTALVRKARIEPDAAVSIERQLARKCGMTWEDLCDAYQAYAAAHAAPAAA